MNKKLHNWILASYAELSSSPKRWMASEHVDYFLEHEIINTYDSFPTSVDLFLESVGLLATNGWDDEYMLRLVIPFYWVDGILFHDSHYYLRTEEPPSLYMVKRSWHLTKRAGDFYKKTIEAFDSRLESPNYHTYYRCGIYDSWDRNYDLDYMRDVCVDHYTDELLR